MLNLGKKYTEADASYLMNLVKRANDEYNNNLEKQA